MKKTGDLYRAAFWLAIGGKVWEISGSYPHAFFIIKPRGRFFKLLNFFLRNKLELVNWKKLKRKRVFLKNAVLSGAYRRNKSFSVALRKAKNDG